MQLQRGKIRAFIFGLILIGIGVLAWPQDSAWAGDINGAESGVIAAASGTFTYKGKKYRAYSSYVNRLYNYLSKDGVNLSSAQASKAINYIYSNVKTGISSGYLYEVGGDDDPDIDHYLDPDDLEDETEEETETEEGSTAKATTEQGEHHVVATETATDAETDPGSGSGQPSANSGSTQQTTEIEDIFSQIEKDQDTQNQLNERVDPKDADVSATIKDEAIVIDTGDGEPIELESNKRIVPEAWTIWLVIVAITAFVIAAIACLILILKKCMRFKRTDRKKPMHGHRKRRRIRKICRRILTFTTAIGFVGSFLLMAILVIVFNNSRILQNVQDSGYFRYAYIEYLAEQGKTEKDTTEVSKAVDISYDDFVIREKQATEQLLLGNRDVKYQQSNVAPYVLRLKEDMQTSILISGIFFVLTVILGCIFTIFMDLRRDRGIRMIAVSELIGTVFAGILTVILLWLNPARHLFIEPDYLYLFFKNHVDWMIRVLSVITVFGLVLGMSLIGIYFSRRKEKGV